MPKKMKKSTQLALVTPSSTLPIFKINFVKPKQNVQSKTKAAQTYLNKQKKKKKAQNKNTHSKQELMNMFPVSSGEQHKKQEQSLLGCSSNQLGYQPKPIATIYPSIMPRNIIAPGDTASARVANTSSKTNPISNISKLPFYALPYSASETASSTSSTRQPSQTAQQSYHSNPLFAAYPESTGFSQTQSHKNKSAGNQPWAKRDSLTRLAPYSGGKGMDLLQKMGWNPGQGLGKRKDGSLEPHAPNFKFDKRGFDVKRIAQQPVREWGKKKQLVKRMQKPQGKGAIQIVTEGKNPISILDEYCKKKKCDSPRYEAIVEEGPIHAKNYVFKVVVEAVEYHAVTGSNVKSKAKAEAATVCLKKLGILPA